MARRSSKTARPRKSHDEILSDMAELHDRNLLKLVRKGKKTVLNQDGDPVEVDLTAADLNAITNRLKACNVTVANKQGSTVNEIEKEMESAGLRLADHLPAVSDDRDAASA
jgi:hypothetical protein